MPGEPSCPNGHRGAPQRVEARRWPGVVVVLGFTIFVMSIVGAAIGSVLLLAGGTIEKVVQDSQRTPEEIRQDLQREAVPEPIVAAVLGERDSSLTPEEAASLTPSQTTAVQRAQLSVIFRDRASLPRDFSPAEFRSASAILLAISLAGGVVGWLLRAKTWRVCCAECGATVPAS